MFVLATLGWLACSSGMMIVVGGHLHVCDGQGLVSPAGVAFDHVTGTIEELRHFIFVLVFSSSPFSEHLFVQDVSPLWAS